MPVDVDGRTHVAVGINPSAIFDVHDVSGIRRKIGEKLLNCRQLITTVRGLAGEIGHPLHVIRVAAAPGIIAIVREKNERWFVRIVPRI